VELVEELRRSRSRHGFLAPVIRDQFGNVVDGEQRLRADPHWPCIIYKEIQTEEALLLMRIAFNWVRREKPGSWKRDIIARLLSLGNSAEDIAAKTGLSLSTIYHYMPPQQNRKTQTRSAQETSSKTSENPGELTQLEAT
jgi:ParB-like chromosome segregation protein Spo0J